MCKNIGPVGPHTSLYMNVQRFLHNSQKGKSNTDVHWLMNEVTKWGIPIQWDIIWQVSE